MSPTTAGYLRGYLSATTFSDARLRETLALALSSSDFQWY
jgi:hypothetical protein